MEIAETKSKKIGATNDPNELESHSAPKLVLVTETYQRRVNLFLTA